MSINPKFQIMTTVRIDPNRFTDKPFTLRKTWPHRPDDFVILIDGFQVGRIMRLRKAFQALVFFWTMTRPNLPAQLEPSNGECETLEGAQEAFKAKFCKWQSWAIRTGLIDNWIVPKLD
jgi:hypothetical protein